MDEHDSNHESGRRQFLARMTVGAGVIGVAATIAEAGSPAVPAQATPARFQPARHTQDDWLDQIPGQHRFIFDTTTPPAMDTGLMFATNYFIANRNGYGLQDSDLAVVVVARHNSTPFAFNDAIWGKYGVAISNQAGFVDPRTKEPAKVNAYASRLESLIKRGAHLAVCQMAARAFAGVMARSAGGNTEAVYEEITRNLLPNSHIVPAGIVAVNRAQERGYTFVTAG
jgi:intracellular sulfur oxidation DsrE/DsrF family protein